MSEQPQQIQEAGPGRPQRSKRSAIIAWIVAPIIGVVFFPTIILLTVGMAPTLVAFIIDRRPRKFAARAVGYLNFTGCLPFALKMWTGSHSLDSVLDILSSPISWFVMYSAAAGGWVIYFLMPPIVAAWMAVASEVKAKAIRARQEELIKEWGAEVKQGFRRARGTEEEGEDGAEPSGEGEEDAPTASS